MIEMHSVYMEFVEQHPDTPKKEARAVHFTSQQKTLRLLKQIVQFARASRLHCLWHGPPSSSKMGGSSAGAAPSSR